MENRSIVSSIVQVRAALAVGVIVWGLASCSGGGAARLTESLEQRAPHLSSREAGLIVDAVLRAQRRTGVDHLLLLSVIEQESSFKPRSVGPRGALGLMQVRPSTGKEVADRHGIRWRGDATLYDLRSNVLIGASYLRDLEARFKSLDLALTAYNQGPRRARRIATKGRSPSSRYSARVLERRDSWSVAVDR